MSSRWAQKSPVQDRAFEFLVAGARLQKTSIYTQSRFRWSFSDQRYPFGACYALNGATSCLHFVHFRRLRVTFFISRGIGHL